MNAKYPIYLQLLKASAKKHQQTEQPAVAWQPTDTTKKSEDKQSTHVKDNDDEPNKKWSPKKSKKTEKRDDDYDYALCSKLSPTTT